MIPTEHVADLECRPTFGMEAADAAHECAGFTVFHGPHSEPEERPVAVEDCHLAPCVGAAERAAVAEVPSDSFIRHDVGVGVEVALLERAQAQARREYLGNDVRAMREYRSRHVGSLTSDTSGSLAGRVQCSNPCRSPGRSRMDRLMAEGLGRHAATVGGRRCGTGTPAREAG